MNLKRSYTTAEIAAMIHCEIIGDETIPVNGINEIHMVRKGDLTFVDHPKYYNKALSSAATTIIINTRVACPEGKSLLLSEDPFSIYNQLTHYFSPIIPPHSQQYIKGENVSIGSNSYIYPGVVIGNNVTIGNSCIIYPNVVIYDNTIIKDDVILQANCVIGGDAFYYKRRPDYYEKMHSCGRVILEDHVEIGACSTIDRGVSGDTIIGKGTKIDNHVHIGHDTMTGENCLLAAQVGVAGVVRMEDEVILWGQVGVQKDITIGKKTIALGQSGITKSVEGGKTYFGTPAHEVTQKLREYASLKKLPAFMKRHGE